MAIPMKGLRDILTLSGRVDQISVPYRAYMRISCLEMEKTRRGNERESAARRIAIIDARIQEIEAEKGMLLGRVNERNSDGAGTRGAAPRLIPRASTGGFKLRY